MLSTNYVLVVFKAKVVVVVRCHNVKNGKEARFYRSKIQQDALGKVNRAKEIRRRENYNLLSQLHFVMKSREGVM